MLLDCRLQIPSLKHSRRWTKRWGIMSATTCILDMNFWKICTVVLNLPHADKSFEISSNRNWLEQAQHLCRWQAQIIHQGNTVTCVSQILIPSFLPRDLTQLMPQILLSNLLIVWNHRTGTKCLFYWSPEFRTHWSVSPVSLKGGLVRDMSFQIQHSWYTYVSEKAPTFHRLIHGLVSRACVSEDLDNISAGPVRCMVL